MDCQDYITESVERKRKRQIVVNQRQRKAVTGSGFAYCLHGWQPWKAISRQAAARQCGQEIFQIACRVQSIGLCGLNQRIDHCADLRAKRRIAEQPVLSSNGKRPNRALCAVVGQLQPSAAENVHQPALLPQGISRSTHAKGSPARFKACRRYAQPPPAASAAGGGLIFSDVIAHRSGLCSPPGSFPAAASFRCSPPQRPRPAKAASAPPLGIAQARFHRPAPCPKGRSE